METGKPRVLKTTILFQTKRPNIHIIIFIGSSINAHHLRTYFTVCVMRKFALGIFILKRVLISYDC